jgi:hypothetical protein
MCMGCSVGYITTINEPTGSGYKHMSDKTMTLFTDITLLPIKDARVQMSKTVEPSLVLLTGYTAASMMLIHMIVLSCTHSPCLY